MVAPMIPAINDMEMERILDAAAARGAQTADMRAAAAPGEDDAKSSADGSAPPLPDRLKPSPYVSWSADARGVQGTTMPPGASAWSAKAPAPPRCSSASARAKERFNLTQKFPPCAPTSSPRRARGRGS